MTKQVFSHFKLQGEWAELLFMARAAELGLSIVRPWGDSSPYDLALVCPEKACPEKACPDAQLQRPSILRVQVKSTLQTAKHKNGPRGAYLCNTISRGPGGKVRTYSPAEVDFFALFVIPLDLWYIVPLAQLRPVPYALLLDTTRPGNRYFKYLEAWHLLRS